MMILCYECGHRLRAEAGSIGAFGMVDFFDDRPKSGTFGERGSRAVRAATCDCTMASVSSDVEEYR